jgi:alkylhydroperoxidase family enzyme
MAVINGVARETAPADVLPIYDDLTKAFGRVPNIFAVMAHRPGALKHLLALYGTIMPEGTVDARYKELAYLKTSLVNGCEY